LDAQIRRGNAAHRLTFSELRAVDESKYLSEFCQFLLQGKIDHITGNAENITQHFVSVIAEDDTFVLGRAHEIKAHSRGLIPDAFQKYFEPLFQIIFKSLQTPQSIAEPLADHLAQRYPPSERCQTILRNSHSMRLFNFVKLFVHPARELLTDGIACRILSLYLYTSLAGYRNLKTVPADESLSIS
jgi:hypothetical protein